jgi:hypothetical protein
MEAQNCNLFIGILMGLEDVPSIEAIALWRDPLKRIDVVGQQWASTHDDAVLEIPLWAFFGSRANVHEGLKVILQYLFLRHTLVQ